MVSVIYICDVCKKEVDPRKSSAPILDWRIVRTLDKHHGCDGVKHACSEECFHTVSNQRYGAGVSFTVTTMVEEIQDGASYDQEA